MVVYSTSLLSSVLMALWRAGGKNSDIVFKSHSSVLDKINTKSWGKIIVVLMFWMLCLILKIPPALRENPYLQCKGHLWVLFTQFLQILLVRKFWFSHRKHRNPPFIPPVLVKLGSCAIYIVSGKYTENSRGELKSICMKRFPCVLWNQSGSMDDYGNAVFDFSSLFSEDTLKKKNGTSHKLCCS